MADTRRFGGGDVGITGDFAKLDAVIAEFQDIARNFNRELSAELGRRAMRQVTNAFELQRNPYGRPWKPSQRVQAIQRQKRRNYDLGIGLTLVMTGELLTRMTLVVAEVGFSIRNPLPYANIQNYGWPAGERHPPPALPMGDEARSWLPSNGIWGDIWRSDFEAGTAAVFRRLLPSGFIR